MNADLLLGNIGWLWTQNHVPPVKGSAMNGATVLRDAFVAVKDGRILGCGTGTGSAFRGPETAFADLGGAVLLPGLVDGHTHLVHAGSREHEFALKLAGIPYLDILKRGGGILSTVASTRAATFDDLYDKAFRTLDRMLAFGVTALEAKSGYGLETVTELLQLRVAKALCERHPVEIHSTYMGAHAVPKEYADDREGYLESVLRDFLPIRSERLADSVDVFCEPGVFSLPEARRVLAKAKELGFRIRIHADEIVPSGGAGLAVELGAASADHLVAIADRDIPALAASDVVASLLPGTSFYLGHAFAPARRLIDAGVAVALGSDYNPGSCPSENFQFTMQLAAGKMRMTPSEVLTAATINPAFHLGIADRVGSIAVGKDADFVVFDAPNFEYVLYHFGVNHARDVYKKGRRVVADGWIQKEERPWN